MTARNIVAIGGGDIKQDPPPTLAIDEAIVRLSGKEKPRVLFIPTASGDSEAYREAFVRLYGETLGCAVDQLLLYVEKPGETERRRLVESADIIYVGGGSTPKMLRRWRRLGLDVLLTESWERGAVMCGLSAGANCWFRYANCHSGRKTADEPGAHDLIRAECLGFVPMLMCPHFDSEPERRPGLREMMRKHPNSVAIALDDCAAIHVRDDSFRLVASRDRAQGFRVYWASGEYHEEPLESSGEWRPLDELLTI